MLQYSLIIDHIALAKRGDNALGSVRPSRLSVCSSPRKVVGQSVQLQERKQTDGQMDRRYQACQVH